MFDFGGFNPKFPLLKGHGWAPKGPSPQWSSNATQITSPWPESVQGSFRVARSASEKISLPVTLVTLQGTIGSMDWFTAFSRGIPWFLPPRILANFTLDQCLAWSEWRQRMAFWEYNFCVKQYLVDHTNLLSCILHKLAKRQQDSLALDRWNWGSWQLLALGQKCSNECQTAEDQFTDDRLRGDFFKIWESPKPKFVMSRKESGGFGKVPNLRKHPWKRTRTQGKDYLYDLPFYMTFPWSSPLGPFSTLKSGASNGSGIHKPSTRRSLAHHVRDPFIHGTFLSHVPDRLFDSLRLKGWRLLGVFLPGS